MFHYFRSLLFVACKIGKLNRQGLANGLINIACDNNQPLNYNHTTPVALYTPSMPTYYL